MWGTTFDISIRTRTQLPTMYGSITMKAISRVTVVAGYAGVVMSLLVAMGPPTASPAQAQPPVVTTLAIDMVTTGNDDHTVGSIDPCIAVTAGTTVEFDVVLDAIPTGVGNSDLKAFAYYLGFDAANLTFISQTSAKNDCPPADGLQMLCRAANSCTGLLGCIDASEGVPEPPDSGAPPSPGVHDVNMADSTPGGTVGGGSDPYGKAGGVLGRYEIAVSPTAPTGLYGIGLSDSGWYTTLLVDSASPPNHLWDNPNVPGDDDKDGATDEDLMLDRTVNYGLIAVGVPCPLGGPDSDGDGYWDDDETNKGSDPLDAGSTPEHCDGVDNDGDDPGDGSGVDEGFPDSDGDTVKDCVDPDHPYYTDDDDDDDGFTDEDERWMSTDEQDDCPDASNPWGAPIDDAWPPDIDGNAVCDVTDAILFLAAFPSAEGTLAYSRRLDMAEANGVVDVTDALVFLAHFPSACTNP